MNPKNRLDKFIFDAGLVQSRSQAENYIKLGYVLVNSNKVTKPGYILRDSDAVDLTISDKYVSRAGHKLESVASTFKLNFKDKVVLDVGSSTGGFTDYSLQHGAIKVIAVELGTNQMHPTISSSPKVELHEQTDIRSLKKLSSKPDIVVIDVSFISLREILPHVSKIVTKNTKIVAMVKPQFEAGISSIKHKGVIKNENIRRKILKDFESWSLNYFVIYDKKDSDVLGEKGNKERFYLLGKL